ncbi:DUF1217 domain-containing protein [Pararhizobium sp. BT-229]|uniref:DUF1217 domain-containing protein n=1 Tax=Pararhizobium sp. BT-229 TaxID=2986923 RepID=UPI0021F7753A|nr:DUF1217 domain-containing protein [Pararhizobium sp. BT-229]MCV9963070.1 DUF1217 domain-containing protein [Pararhizobium sp. BT-229]
MVSTYIDYNLITRDMKTSIRRTAEQVQVARETAYYKENIGNVTSIDEFLDDYRLYAYAMKAHGLEDMTYAKAFMRKVMESDLSDENSYANLLTDERYRNFAMAFSFSQSTEVAQSDAQEDALIGLYNQSIANQDDAVRADSVYFNAVLDTVTTVDQLWQNEKLKNYVLTAFGFDPDYVSYAHFKGVVTSDVSDPNSYVNTAAASYKQGYQDKIDAVKSTATPEELADSNSTASKLIAQYQAVIDNAPDYKPLAAAFNFQDDGTLAAGDLPMSDTQKASVNEAYVFMQPRLSSSAAQLNKLFYESTIASVTKVDDITSNSRLFAYIRISYGLPASFLTSTMENILTSDLSDPNSYANTQGGTEYNAIYKELAAAFNFQTDGTLASGDTAQTAAQMATTSDYWLARYNDADEAADESLIASYKTLIGVVADVDDLLSDTKIMRLALTAVGLEDEGDTARKLKKVLTSDLTDPNSYVYTLKDERYVELAKAFNFNADGTLGVPMLAQSESEILNTAKSYVVEKSRFGTEDDKTKATEESKYYSAEIEKIETLDDLLSNRRLVDFILVAAGLDPEEVTTDYLRQMFESDFSDPKSFINTEPGTTIYKDIVASYNFDSDGNLAKPTPGIQTKRGVLETEDLYFNQTLEEQKGEENAGVRLALYFRRQAEGISTAYDFLADSALLQVIQTTFSIPEAMSSADVDIQYDYINRVLDIEDLHDPEKLEKLLIRFTALYDVENNVDVTGAELILSGSGRNGISADTLLSLTQLRTGGA